MHKSACTTLPLSVNSLVPCKLNTTNSREQKNTRRTHTQNRCTQRHLLLSTSVELRRDLKTQKNNKKTNACFGTQGLDHRTIPVHDNRGTVDLVRDVAGGSCSRCGVHGDTPTHTPCTRNVRRHPMRQGKYNKRHCWTYSQTCPPPPFPDQNA